ncbi:ParB/RepB/Spo0J family partition protein [Variovorax paradoxus]|uniref:ParB/RepB/Spo0J family partition protein n=1 Tax=Variovorax paradoxus TaxID=34073 RepID=UPI00193198C4|nr:ParB/RepB/Spo0J family partition protein [Variovorax paradoxus]
MSKKLAAKASLIQAPPTKQTLGALEAPSVFVDASTAPAAPREPSVQMDATPIPASQEPVAEPARRSLGAAVTGDTRPRTAPGSMAVFMAAQSSAVKEAQELKIKLRAFEGAVPVRSMDPARIRASAWANRHDDSLANKDFEELRADIAAAGSNVQPICVRPLAEGSDPSHDFELVFGHRRHRACLELALPVRAMVAEMDDQALFEAMERENRARKNLSAWEQGTMYRRALDSGLYPSQRKLAESIGVDLSLVSKSLTLARLPESVVKAFGSPLDIQFRWAQPLSEALQRDPEGLVARAKGMIPRKGTMSAKQVLDTLLASTAEVLNSSTPPVAERRIGRVGQGAVLGRDGAGRATLRFDAGVLTPERETALLRWLEDLVPAK